MLPGIVATNMSGIEEPGLLTPSPSDYVRSVLKKVGVLKRCSGYWPHDVQVGNRLLICKLIFSVSWWVKVGG